MRTLDDAWRWYREARRQLKLLKRLAARYWEDLPWDGTLGRDDDFRDLAPRELVEAADFSLDHLDDPAVIVLFSVFEAAVRESVLSDVERERSTLRHVALRRAAEDAIDRIEVGSFSWVLESFKGLDADLIEEVNQVRRYRNWAAHGRRGEAPPAVVPQTAYDRLVRFLDLTGKRSPSPADDRVI